MRHTRPSREDGLGPGFELRPSAEPQTGLPSSLDDFRRVTGLHPGAEAAAKVADVRQPHALDRLGGECGSPAALAVEDESFS